MFGRVISRPAFSTRVVGSRVGHKVHPGARTVLRNQSLRVTSRLPTLALGNRRMCTDTSSPSLQKSILSPILNDMQYELLEKEQRLLVELVSILEKSEALPQDIETLKTSISQLNDLFLLVVVGEFNSGKSSFINALLGHKFLEDGVTPTTSKIDTLRYGPEEVPPSEGEERRIITLPVDWLREISLVDTPGTNAIYRGHQQITEHFLPRADLVLWTTSSDRPFSQSEKEFLEQVKFYQKKVIVVLTKIDMVEKEDDLKKITDFIREQFNNLSGSDPIIFPISSKLALRAKQELGPELKTLSPEELSNKLSKKENWTSSQFDNVESYIKKTLSEEERAWLKLRNPIGIADHLLQKYLTDMQVRLDVLSEDAVTNKRIETELAEYRSDMLRDYTYHLDRIDAILLKLEERGTQWLNDNIGITNIMNLANSKSVKQEFEAKVIGRTIEDIEAAISDLVDWLLKKNSKQWNNIMEFIDVRTRSNQHQFVGKISTQFDYNRKGILKDMKGSASTVVASFDHNKEGEHLSSSIRAGVYQTAAIEIGAVGGSIIIPTLFDISGILPASALAVVGLGVLPFWRQKLRTNLNSQIADLRTRLKDTLELHFQKQLDSGIQDITENISPYTHFVRSQLEFVLAINKELQGFKTKVDNLHQEVDSAFSR